MFRFIIATLIFTASAQAAAGNYARCLLHELPGSANDIVARASMNICLKKHPKGLSDVRYGSGRSFFGFGYSDPNECLAGEAKSTASSLAVTHIRIACNRLYSESDEPGLMRRITSEGQTLTQSLMQSLMPSPALVESEPAAVTRTPVDVELPVATKSSASENKTAEELHYEKIYQAHPDADGIYDSAEFQDWIEQQPARQNALVDGTTQEIIRLFNEYKNIRAGSPVASQQEAAKPEPEVLRPPRNACEFKAVMTNADYAACGLTPPRGSGR